MTERSFPLPSEIADVPGAEGWQAMYPYFTRFQPEDDKRFWFYNSMHFPEPMPAFDMITAEVPYSAIGANTARVFVFPTTLGIEHRIVNGRVYIAANPVTDPAEIGRRAADFQRAGRLLLRELGPLYDEWKMRIEGADRRDRRSIERARTAASSTRSSRGHRARGVSPQPLRCARTSTAASTCTRMWHHHSEFLMLGYGAYVVFFEFCKQAFPEISDQTVARMVAGMDVIMFRPDDELSGWRALAVELGRRPTCSPRAARRRQGAGRAGRARRGRRSAGWPRSRRPRPLVQHLVGDGFYHHHRRWDDDLSCRSPRCPATSARSRPASTLDRPTEQLQAEERDRIAATTATCSAPTRRRPPSTRCSACAGWFPVRRGPQVLLRALVHHLFFNKIREFGALLARSRGSAPRPRTCSSCTHFEVEDALVRRHAGLGRGRPAARARRTGRRSWPSASGSLEALRGWTPPPALGPVPEVINDPAVTCCGASPSETLEAWLGAERRRRVDGPRLRAPRSGVVEGAGPGADSTSTRSAQIREGEILVCQVTAPSWAPMFGKIAGGGLRHRRLDVPRGDRGARIRPAGRGRHRHATTRIKDRPARPRRRRPRRRHRPRDGTP